MEIIKIETKLSNMYVVKDDKTMIVDAGAGTFGDEYRSLVKNAVNESEVSLIVITHGHLDHCEGLDLLREMYPEAKVLAHKNTIKFLETGEYPAYVPRGEYGPGFVEFANSQTIGVPKNGKVDIVVDDEDYDLSEYGIHGKVIYTPGHTDSAISVILDTKETIVGDNVLQNPFNNFAVTTAVISDDPKALKDSVTRLVNEANTFYCGHAGKIITCDEVKEALKEL
ncbi:MAG: MBL fold metallo-hydrolase [Traorella sp.]